MNAAVCQGRTVAFIFRVSVKVLALRAHLHTRLLLARMFSLHAERMAALWWGGEATSLQQPQHSLTRNQFQTNIFTTKALMAGF